MTWEKGRQGTGYLKKLLAQGQSWDLYLLKFPKGSNIDGHTDPVPGKRHYRANFVLKRARKGGEFWCRGRRAGKKRLAVFRPDIEIHGVSYVQRGTRWVLSLGWVKEGHGHG